MFLLNRLRGIFGWFSKVNALMLIFVFTIVTHNIQMSVLIGLGYLLGESFGWGKWIGSIGTRTPNPNEQEGTKIGIHYLANLVFNEKKDYLNYARLALFLRGALWWFLTLLPLVIFGYIGYATFAICVVFLGVVFPLSVEIARLTQNKISFKYFKGFWEQAEVYYGLAQDVILIYLIWSIK